jgi:hypothetical protein
MERKRVAGRFVAEDEDGVQKKRMAAALPAKSRRTFTRRLAEILPKIVERFSREAKKGSIQHAKVLMKLGGLDQRESPVKPRQQGKGPAGLLLKDLKKGRKKSGAVEQDVTEGSTPVRNEGTD